MSYTPEQLTTLQHVVQDMDTMRDRRLRELGPDDVLGEPEPDVVKVSEHCGHNCPSAGELLRLSMGQQCTQRYDVGILLRMAGLLLTWTAYMLVIYLGV